MDVSSAIDAVTVYPDGATVTRTVSVDLPQGDTTLIARDFPPGLDPASLRVEGETARARHHRGDRCASAARRAPAEHSGAREALVKHCATSVPRSTTRSRAETARKKFAERFASETPFGVGEKAKPGRSREWRAAFCGRRRGNPLGERRDPRREAEAARDRRARSRASSQSMQANPARKMEVRIDLAADAPSRATFRVSYTVRGARWAPLYDARLDYRHARAQAGAGTDPPRRDRAADRRGLERRRAVGFDRAHRQGRQRARSCGR